jgi:hypothetical protein
LQHIIKTQIEFKCGCVFLKTKNSFFQALTNTIVLLNFKHEDKLSFLFQEIEQPLVPSTSLLVISFAHHISLGSSNPSSSFVVPKLK